MPKLEITANEQTTIMNALASEIKSAKRAQNSGKTPRIREIYQIHERELTTLMNKVNDAK